MSLRKKPYVVRVNDVPGCYKQGHFPRKFNTQAAAIQSAKEAVDFGASMARVECPDGGELDYRPDSPVFKKKAKKSKRTDNKGRPGFPTITDLIEKDKAKTQMPLKADYVPKKDKKSAKFEIGERVRHPSYGSGRVHSVSMRLNHPYHVLFDDDRNMSCQAGELEPIPAAELVWENLHPKLQDAIDEYAEAVSNRAMDSEYGTSNNSTIKADKAVQQKKLKLAKLLTDMIHNG